VITGAGFTVAATETEPRIATVGQADAAVRCASVLKPLYFWTASSFPEYAGDQKAWARPPQGPSAGSW